MCCMWIKLLCLVFIGIIYIIIFLGDDVCDVSRDWVWWFGLYVVCVDWGLL